MAINYVLRDQFINSDNALQQHKQNSLAYNFDYTACDRYFSSVTALQQHL